MVRRDSVVLLLGLLIATPAAARAATSIAAIVDDPASYANSQVTVVGTVTGLSAGYGGESIYTLEGDMRRITVVSHQPPPSTGASLQVDAKVGYRAPDEEFTWPPLLLESTRVSAP